MIALRNSNSTILKSLKFLTKLSGQAIPYSAVKIEVGIDETFAYRILIVVCIETNGLTRLRVPIPEDTFFRDFMNVGLPREIFNYDKPESFALIALFIGTPSI